MAAGLVLTRRVSERGMHHWAQRAVDPTSSRAISEYVGYEEWARDGFLRREVARCGASLILAFGDGLDVHGGEPGPDPRRLEAFVVGHQSGSGVTGVAGHQLGVQVELTAAGALALLGDVASYNDAVVPLDDALGRTGSQLVERLAGASTWAVRFDLLDASFARSDIPALSPEVAWLRRQLVRSQGQGRVEPLMDETGWSRRHVTEGFRRQIGLTPKAYARLLRFRHATALLQQPLAEESLADVAMKAGYYDQSHFTREFAALAGTTPGAYAADASSAPAVRFVQDPDETAPA